VLCREVAWTVLPPQGAHFPQISLSSTDIKLIPAKQPKVTLGLRANFSQLELRRPGILGERFADVTDQLIAKFSG
jgi:hypothetical protein